MRGKSRPHPLETRLAAQRAERGLIVDIGQVGVAAVGPAPPHCPLEHRQRLIAPALHRPDRRNVGIEREGNGALAIDRPDPARRLREQPVGVCRAPAFLSASATTGRLVQLIGAHRLRSDGG